MSGCGSGDPGWGCCSVSALRLGTTVNVFPFRLFTSGLGAGTRRGSSTSISSMFVMGSCSPRGGTKLGDTGGDSRAPGEEGVEVRLGGDAEGIGLVATGEDNSGGLDSYCLWGDVLGEAGGIVTGFATGLVGGDEIVFRIDIDVSIDVTWGTGVADI